MHSKLFGTFQIYLWPKKGQEPGSGLQGRGRFFKKKPLYVINYHIRMISYKTIMSLLSAQLSQTGIQNHLVQTITTLHSTIE